MVGEVPPFELPVEFLTRLAKSRVLTCARIDYPGADRCGRFPPARRRVVARARADGRYLHDEIDTITKWS